MEDLDSLGIKHFRGANGRQTFAIEIVGGQGDAAPRTAVFDGDLKVWRLVSHRSTDESHATPSTTALSAKAGARPSADDWPSGRAEMDGDSPMTGAFSGDRPFINDRPAPSHGIDGVLRSDDWSNGLPQSEHTDFFLGVDWANSSLGELAAWPHALRLYTNLLFRDVRPAAIYWGPEWVALYNDNLPPLVGSLHPSFMGQPANEALAYQWSILGPIFNALKREAGRVIQGELEVPITSDNGQMMETWWDGGLITLKDDDGNYGGIYSSWVPITRTVLRDRRMNLITRLGRTSATTSESMWQHLFEALEASPKDIPMAIMYALDDSDDGGQRLVRKQTIGIGTSYAAAPQTLDLALLDDETPLSALLRRARDSSSDFTVIDCVNGGLDPVLTDGIEWQGHGEPSRHMIVIALRPGDTLRGYICIGLNPRTELDDDHLQFITDLGRILHEVVRRATNTQQAQAREHDLTQRLTEQQRRTERLVNLVPAGIYEMSLDGKLVWANSQFYDTLGVAAEDRQLGLFDWKEYVSHEDWDVSQENLARCLIENVQISGSVRLQRTWAPPPSTADTRPAAEPFWMLYRSIPFSRTGDSSSSLLGSIFDISHIKWAEKLQMRSALKADAERKHLEDFIDVVSHEMRNPLSAVLQCADAISASAELAQDPRNDVRRLRQIVEQNVEAAQAILFCAAHQKRIIDDVLTLGKLNAEGSMFCPAIFEPQFLVAQAVQMFKAELVSADIEIDDGLDESPTQGASCRVYGDASRTIQIIINLLTNSIKFTRTQKVREIKLRFGMTPTPPSPRQFGQDFQWFPTNKTRPDLVDGPDYGEGDVIYFYFAVGDTGQGIASELRNRVFSKFDQGDKFTHTKYGGSGLGLHISRELSELHGGRIGLQSQEAIGSTFAFYIKVKRASESATESASLEDSQPTTPLISPLPSTPRQDSEPNPPAATGGPDTKGRGSYTVLLVEDNLLNQRILATQLRQAGCTVHLASHGGEAVDFILSTMRRPLEYNSPKIPADAEPVDCILMDWEMPVLDGLKATRRIRDLEAQTGARRTVIVGVTANARVEQKLKAMNAGMDVVMTKPFRVAEVLLQIRQLVS